MGVAERREREREQRRKDIIDAAERVFFGKGPLEATMDDVAAEAELSKGTLYLYFAGKDELYLAIGTRCLAYMWEQLSSLADDGRSGFAALERFCEVHRSFVKEHPDHVKIMLAWQASGFHADPDMPGFPAYQENTLRLFQLIVAVIRRGQADGSIREGLDPAQCAFQIWGGHMGVTMLYFNREEIGRRLPFELDLSPLLPSFSELLLRGLRADETRP